MNRKQFYDVLFNRGEGIGYQTENEGYRKNSVIVHNGDQDEWNKRYTLYSINPIHPTIDNAPELDNPKHATDIPRITIANVTSFRNFAIEFDEGTPKEQGDKLKASGMPYSAIVFSGSKSLHCPIALEEEVSQEDYSAYFEAIRQVLLKYDLKNDPQCKNPNRLTRAPKQIRIHKGEEKLQKLVTIKGRVKNSDLIKWFKDNNINWQDYVWKVPTESKAYEGRGDASDEMRWKAAVSSCIHFNGEYGSADQWNPWLFTLAKHCKAYGLDESISLHFMNRDYTHPDPKSIPTACKNGYKYGNMSPRTLNLPHINIDDQLDTSNLLDDVEDVLPYDFDIANYAWIGDQIYLIYPNKDRVKFSSQGFNARFKRQHLAVADINRIYSSCGYYPDYFNERKLDHNKYNEFRKPDCVPQEGEWPMTKILLEHIFGEQYNLGLEYYWVLRNHPTKPLPAIALTGGEDGGKSSFAQHLDWCFKNTRTIDIDALTNRENSYAIGTQIIVIEESSDSGTNKMNNADGIANKIKTLVTECGKQLPVKRLYADLAQEDYFAHIVLLTNDVSPIRMKGEATRYWVRHVGTPQRIDDFMDKLKAEVRHFLWYLDNEFVPTRRKSKERLWFHPDEYWTIAKDAAKTVSGGRLYNIIKDVFLEHFDTCEENHLNFDSKSLQDRVNYEGESYSKYDVKDCIIKEFKFGEPCKRKRVDDHLALKDIGQTEWTKRKMAYWTIDRDLNIIRETEEMKDLDDVFQV